jgi:hypothetical protein
VTRVTIASPVKSYVKFQALQSRVFSLHCGIALPRLAKFEYGPYMGPMDPMGPMVGGSKPYVHTSEMQEGFEHWGTLHSGLGPLWPGPWLTLVAGPLRLGPTWPTAHAAESM